MTRGEAIKTVSESLLNVTAGRSVFIEDPSPLYDALLLLVGEDERDFDRRHKRKRDVWKGHERERGYHGADGWPVRVR